MKNCKLWGVTLPKTGLFPVNMPPFLFNTWIEARDYARFIEYWGITVFDGARPVKVSVQAC